MSHRRLIVALCELLQSAERLVAGLDRETYARAPVPLADGSIGAHLRHSLDTCRVLVEGVERGLVDYARRERDASVEEDPARGLAASAELRRRLGALAAHPAELPLRVRGESCGAGGTGALLHSTLGRELEVVRSHALHHFAMLALFLRHFGLDPGPTFGVAPSTLAHWEESGRCARLRG